MDNLDIVANSNKMENKKLHLFKPEDAYRVGGWQSKNLSNAGKNPLNGVVFDFFVNDFKEGDTLEIKLFDQDEQIDTWSTVSDEKRTKLKVDNGANQWNWNLSYPPAKRFEGMILWWGNMNGPKARPGNYRARIIYDNDSMEVDFKVLIDPTSEGNIESIQKQFEFINSIKNKIDEAHQAIIDIKDLKKQMKVVKKHSDDEELLQYINETDSIASSLEKLLYQTQNKSNQDPLNFPIKLTNKLAHLNSLAQMSSSDYAPTLSMIEVRDVLTDEINKVLENWKILKEENVRQINKMIHQKQVDFIKLSSLK